jgi:pentatricopeptide repeat protein
MRIPNFNKLQRPEEILDMLAWFEHGPPLSSFSNNPASRLQFAQFIETVKHVSRKLVTLFPGNIDLLIRFALLAVRKDFSTRIPVDFFAHVARLSTFERLQPFLSTLAFRVRLHAERLKGAARDRRDTHLKLVGNAMIRAQVLAARHVDALNMVREVRNLNLGAPAISRDGIETTSKPIEPFTYRLLSEEFSRPGVHPNLLKELLLLQRQDYPTAQGAATQEAFNHTEAEDALETTSKSLASLTRAPRGADNKPKAVYLRLKRGIADGHLPSEKELSAFRRSCINSNERYLFMALSHSLKVSQSELEAVRLRREMQQGHLPTVQDLAKFIDGCVAAKCPEAARNLGEWMEQQTPRFQSLWRVTRMYRLVETGKRYNARLALRIFVDSFMALGVPEQVKDAAERASLTPYLLDDMPIAKPKERLWPSTHGITTAIRALFIQDKTPAYVMATYRSFVQASYASGATLPLASLPDQVSYDAFIQPLAKVGEPDKALEIMHEMRDRGLMPNRHIWDTLIGGYAAYGRLDMVEAILSRMEKQVHVERAQSTRQNALLQETTIPTPFFTQLSVDPAHQLPLQESSPVHPLDLFKLPTPGIVTYTTVIRGLGIAGEAAAAMQYRLRLYRATSVSGARLYKAGENIRTMKALDILASIGTFSAQRQHRLEIQGA